MAFLLPLFGGVFFSLVLVLALVPLFCIIDAATRASDDFRRADSNKTLWIVLLFVFHILAAIVYLAAIRPRVKAASNP